jgi:hypothetical protein
VSEGSPPQRPPQISPDGKWVWDGTEWQPVAGRDSGHTAVFPAFNTATLEPTMTMTAPAQQAPVPFSAPVAPVNYAVNYSTPQASAPLWQVKPGRWNNYLYVAAAVVVLVMAMIFLNSLGSFSLPWFGGSSRSSTPAPAPSVLNKRSDYAVASRFLTAFLAPAMSSFNKTVSTQVLSCNGVMTVGCQAALIETDNQVKNAVAVVNDAPAPVCIVPNVSKVKIDLAGLDAFLQNALQAYTDGSKSGLAAGLAGFAYEDRMLQGDILAAFKAQASFCDTQLTGP